MKSNRLSRNDQAACSSIKTPRCDGSGTPAKPGPRERTHHAKQARAASVSPTSDQARGCSSASSASIALDIASPWRHGRGPRVFAGGRRGGSGACRSVAPCSQRRRQPREAFSFVGSQANEQGEANQHVWIGGAPLAPRSQAATGYTQAFGCPRGTRGAVASQSSVADLRAPGRDVRHAFVAGGDQLPGSRWPLAAD